jgi:hypothetical protein
MGGCSIDWPIDALVICRLLKGLPLRLGGSAMRAVSLFGALGLLSATMATFSVAQGLQSDPEPVLPPSYLGPQLIVWSQLQKPQPVPQPLPDPPDQQQDKQASPTTTPTAVQSSSLTLIGKIVKDNGKYVLKISKEKPYQLDDQQKAGQYENKDVKVVGTLDEDKRSVRIISIEIIS